MRTLLYEVAMSLITCVRPYAGGSLQAWRMRCKTAEVTKRHAWRWRVG